MLNEAQGEAANANLRSPINGVSPLPPHVEQTLVDSTLKRLEDDPSATCIGPTGFFKVVDGRRQIVSLNVVGLGGKQTTNAQVIIRYHFGFACHPFAHANH